MKITIASLLCCFVLSIAAFAKAETKTETFKVYGNCNMCKANIEGALKKKDGIISKKWDVEKKELTVTYDPTKISIKEIGQKIADAGYDNQYATATDEKYNTLMKCCQYDRPKKG